MITRVFLLKCTNNFISKLFKISRLLCVIFIVLFLLLVLFRYLNEKHLFSRSNIKTSGLNADLIMRQHKLDKMAKFMEIKSNNPKLKQTEIAKLLELSASTRQRCKKETNMLSPYRIRLSSKTNHARKQKTPNTNLDDVKVTSNDLKMTSNDLIKI